MMLEIQQNEGFMPKELRRSTLKAVISNVTARPSTKRISLQCEYDQQVCMITYNV